MYNVITHVNGWWLLITCKTCMKDQRPFLFFNQETLENCYRNDVLCQKLNIYTRCHKSQTPATTAGPTCSERASVNWQTKRGGQGADLWVSGCGWRCVLPGWLTVSLTGGVVTSLLVSLLLSLLSLCSAAAQLCNWQPTEWLSCRGLSRPVSGVPGPGWAHQWSQSPSRAVTRQQLETHRECWTERSPAPATLWWQSVELERITASTNLAKLL